MASTLRSRRGGGLIEALRFPLRLRVVGGAAAHSDSFRAWAWEDHHRSFMGPWAAMVIAYICLLLRDMQGALQAITISMIGLTAFSLAAISFNLVPFIKRENQHKWARHAIIQFSALQITLTYIIAFEGHYPGDSLIRVCTYWLDIFTNLFSTVPSLAIADWSTGEWAVYVLLHVTSSAPLFVNWMDYPILLAVFKVLVIQSLGLFVYITMERSKFALFFVQLRQQQLRLEKTLAHLDAGPSLTRPGSIPASYTPPSSDNQGKGAQEQAPSVQKLCQAEVSDELPCYKPVLRRHEALIKIDSDIKPETLQASAHCQHLYTQIVSRFPKCVMVETAVRRGCILLSLHLCELLRLAQQQPDQANRKLGHVTEMELANEVACSALKWVVTQGPLEDGTVISVQVNSCTFRGIWNSSMQALELSQDAAVPPVLQSHQYSITLPEPALLLPPISPAAHHARNHADSIRQSGTRPLLQEHLPNSKYARGVSFAATIRVPVGAPPIVGWQEQESQEHVTRVGRGEKLVVLATVRSRCLPVVITQQTQQGACVPSWDCPAGTAPDEEQERMVQVSISLPPELLTNNHCLKLELVCGSIMLCCRNVLLMSSTFVEVQQEIKDWALALRTPDQIAAFVDDLAEFLSFQSLVNCDFANNGTDDGCGRDGHAAYGIDETTEGSGGHGLESGLSGNGLLDVLAAEARRPEMDLIMGEVGLDLLHHAISWGMTSLAERLLAALMAQPLSLPFGDIARGWLPHMLHHVSPRNSAFLQGSEQELPKQQQHQLHSGPELATSKSDASTISELQACDCAKPVQHHLSPRSSAIPQGSEQELQQQQEQQQEQQLLCLSEAPSAQQGQLEELPKQQQQQLQQGPELAASRSDASAFPLEMQACNSALLPVGFPSAARLSNQAPSLPCQSLLTLALLSYNRRSLALVLEWGRLHGNPVGHTWAWDAIDACGYSPIQLMQRMPQGHPLLLQLLSDETAAPAAAHAQLLAQQMRESLDPVRKVGRRANNQSSGMGGGVVGSSSSSLPARTRGRSSESSQHRETVGVIKEQGGREVLLAPGGSEVAAAAEGAAAGAPLAGKASPPFGVPSSAPSVLGGIHDLSNLHSVLAALLRPCSQLMRYVLHVCGWWFSLRSRHPRGHP